jgi:plastocyanin
LTMNRFVWAFKLGGTVAQRPAPPPPPTTIGWTGQVQETTAITLGVVQNFNIVSANSQLTWADEYGIAPNRARVKAGTAVGWKNTSKLVHTIAARDGSWTTGAIQPGATGTAAVMKPGTYEYTCKDHPWSVGQLIVE